MAEVIPFLFAVSIAAALLTGKSPNPLRGRRPFIVTRRGEPRRYWGSIAVLVVLFLIFFGVAALNGLS